MSDPYPEFPRQTVEALGIKTSYIAAGEPRGEPVILLHGMTSSGDTYREMMHELQGEFWLIAPDLPGFGYSDHTTPYTLAHLVEWLAAFREALDLPPMILVGHSFGGALATSYTHFYPEDVTRLLLIAPAVLAGEMYPDVFKRLGLSLRLADLTAALSESRAMAQQVVKQSFYAPEKQPPSVWERRLGYYELARASADVLKALAFHDSRQALQEIQQPVFVVWGADDPVLPATQAEKIARLLPRGLAIVLEECGHMLMLEQQAQFQAIAHAFFRGEDASQAWQKATRKEAGPGAKPVIAVFGGSAPRDGEAAYAQARQVGRLLAEAGFAVATGGYSGTMMAASQGAAEAGGHVIGVTCDQIEVFRPMGANEFVLEEIRYKTLPERLLHLVQENQGMIVLPGGIGTLSEMALAWSLLQVGEITPRPLCLLGDNWRQTIEAFADPAYVREKHLDLLYFAGSPEAAVDYIKAWAAGEQTTETGN